jgi:23S rRNA (adenine2030-N6)-methyltransferase
MIITDHISAGSAYLGCELRKDDYQTLRETLDGRGRAFLDDGYAIAVKTARRMGDDDSERDLFLLMDPPFERADDYQKIVETLYDVLLIKPDVKALIWLPIKDLETLDAFVRALEPLATQAQIAIGEVRLRPLNNPMKMNGCALVALNLGAEFQAALRPILEAAVTHFGEAGGLAKLWTLK